MKLINTRTYRKFRYCLSRKHELPSDKFIINPLLLVSLIPFLGALYLWSFFMQFKIDYMQLYFKVEDCVSTIYSNLIFFYFIIAIIILGSSFLFFDYSHNIKNNNLKKVQIYLIEFLLSSVIVIINHAIFQVFWSQFLLSLFFIFAIIILFNKSINLGIFFLLFYTSVFICFLGKEHAINISKNRPTYNIILNDGKAILKEGEKDKYFIYKTSEYYFIRDVKNNKVLTYSTQDVKQTSFTP